ncbi:MAG TPA: Gfo/Idh/MocA family oxidoreductase [Lacipirellulaceae bacterium]|nr:Gfo/Idh/MocA family oxidoreductase [Lacipirellulaceae bacterium]
MAELFNSHTRRDFLKTSAAASTALAALSVPRFVHAGVDETFKIGLIGCGKRGSGAAVDAMSADPHVRLVAMGDTFEDCALNSRAAIKRNAPKPEQVAVENDHIFSGFDAYKKVIDSGVDSVILTTPPHFRAEQLRYAIEKGKHAFVEKPVATDVPRVHEVMATCDEAKKKGLAVVSGLCWRYAPKVKDTIARVQDGAIGDIVAIQSCYNTGTGWYKGDDPKWSRMEYQIRNWIYYTWLGGDHIVEQAIHSLDKTAWLQGDVSPKRAMGLGGRQQRTDKRFGNIFDHHTVFYEYPSGVRVFFTCRRQDNCSKFVDEIVLGTKGKAQIIKGVIEGEKPWRYSGPGKRRSMYRDEHVAMIKSIRDGKPINNGKYMCNSTLIAIMGRMCTYTGQDLTWEQVLNSKERLGPSHYAWTNVPEPPVPIPGKTKFL